MIGPGTLGFRLIAFAGAWIAGALLAGGLLLNSVFENQVRHSFDARLDVLLETLVAVTDADGSGGVRLFGAQGEARFERPFSGWYWQITAARPKAAPPLVSRSLWDQVLALPAAATADNARTARYSLPGPRGQNLRIAERRISFETGGTFRYAVAGNEAEIIAELHPFRVTLAWSLGLLGLGLIGAVMIQVYFGLRPLRLLRVALARVRTGQARRIEGDFPGEVRPLVSEANQLIAQVSDVIERARTHVGNLAHALKTPLTVLAVEAEKDSGAQGETLRREIHNMRERIDHHLARARTAASAGVIGQRTEITPIVDALVRTLSRMQGDRKLDIRSDVPTDLAFRGDSQDLEEMLGNLMDNACKWARTSVIVGAAPTPGNTIALWVEDDGPGLKPEDRARALARGGRLDESMPGSGLGLDIVSEIAALYGGGLVLDAGPEGGLRAVLELPAAKS